MCEATFVSVILVTFSTAKQTEIERINKKDEREELNLKYN